MKSDELSLPFLCTAGIDEISVDAYKGVEQSESDDSDKSDSSDSEYASDEEQKTKDGKDTEQSEEAQKAPTKTKVKEQEKESKASTLLTSESGADDAMTTGPDASTKGKVSKDSEKDSSEKSKGPPKSPSPREKAQVKEEAKQTVQVEDSDSERELVIDLGEEQGGKDKKRGRKDNTVKESSVNKHDGENFNLNHVTFCIWF